ncbi:hypothetical protein [Amycolatopsis azurea]|uniref:Uncharacterized protein n=1 Tax=Amycolatopsis azurea DSM 43854 TaxID=1238180 RepID=M2QJ84_9PSEU|nr:hypothetical protein [Amycolatopsis azurea]EMD25937.1 hypothetical protein C791_3878 [Amycolatopsis azurea DSM 43854]
MTTRISETRRRPGRHADAARPLISIALEKLPRLLAKPEQRPRDRRVQRLRGWLSGVSC